MNDLVYLKNDEAVCDTSWKSIYVLRAEDETVKIGVSKNVEQRIKTLQGASGKKIVECFCTQKCSNAYLIETIILKHFSLQRMCGEWTSADFKEVVRYAEEVFAEKSKFEHSKAWDVEGAWAIFERMCLVDKNSEAQVNILSMTIADLLNELKVTYDAFVELCGEDDEICTIPAKEKYEQMLAIIDYVDELSGLQT